MKAPEKFRIVITGDTSDVSIRDRISPAIGYLMTRLLTGEEVGDGVWTPFGLTVEVEEDADQGDE